MVICKHGPFWCPHFAPLQQFVGLYLGQLCTSATLLCHCYLISCNGYWFYCWYTALVILLMWSVAAVSSGMSFLLSSTLAVLLFASMQMYKVHLASHEWATIVGGFLGSLLFCLVLTVSSDIRLIICSVLWHC